MFDSHAMPRHAVLRLALRPIITQAWHALSTKTFNKVLFCPERLNIRALPFGGSSIAWHTDQPALSAVCREDDEERSYGFLDDMPQAAVM